MPGKPNVGVRRKPGGLAPHGRDEFIWIISEAGEG
jgi:hypothetical protein